MTKARNHEAHVRECRLYGVRPLTKREFARLRSEGLDSLRAAFSVASDLQAGWTWRVAVDAFKVQEG